jgi:dephospho-CoA kinase
VAYKIGLTGNIGCGKSEVGAMLRELGAEYIDADRVVHELLGAGSAVAERVIERFGPQVRAADGGVDRRRLGQIVFNDRPALAELEEIVVPGVRAEIRRRVAASSAPVVVVDAIKLIEGGLAREMDTVWVVVCDPADQRRRLTELRGLTAEEAEARIAAQPPQEEKLPFAEVVIDNRGRLDQTRRQVEAAWRRTAGAKIAP